MEARHPDDEVVINWLRSRAIPIDHLQLGTGFDDLRPLKQILSDVQVIGLGEATHGTREFFQLKHRLVEFLVTELGFTVFSIEASHAACLPINEYVLHGVGERDEVLVGQGYLAWSMEESSALLAWIRVWNERAPEDRKVQFWGTDVTFNENGRQTALSYLRRLAPDRLTTTEAIFTVLAEEENKWFMRIDEASEERVRQVLPDLDYLIASLDSRRGELAGRSSEQEFDYVRFLLSVMGQWWTEGAGGRSGCMGRSLVHLIEREPPDTRVVYWGHNCHVGVEMLPDGNPSAGHVLRQRYGDAYYACALEFGEGSYQTRIVGEDKFMADFKHDRVGPTQRNSLPWYLSQVGLEACLVNLRDEPRDPSVERWLHTPRTEHGGTGWAYGADPEASYEPVTVGEQYDGLAFVERSTPSHPTAAALKAAAARAFV